MTSTTITGTTTTASKKASILNAVARCTCGMVEAKIHTLETAPPPLRLVCYCSDCRGYYETLNRMAAITEKGNAPSSAILDNWGGVDWTALYPRDITITKGTDRLQTTIIRPTSTVRQVYASCCHTPLFRFGEMSVLMNSHLILLPPNEMVTTATNTLPPIEFRIIGRDSWKEYHETNSNIVVDAPPVIMNNNREKPAPPTMSWSVPLRWFWVMPGRIRSSLMSPVPWNELPTAADVKAGKVPVLKEFQAGSK